MVNPKKIKSKFDGLTTSKKIQVVLASMVTISLLIATPVLAWFSFQRRIVKVQKVEAPNTLVLSAAHREDCVCLNVEGINADEIAVDVFGTKLTETVGEGEDAKVQDKKITYQDYVFCVSGDAVEKFTIQLAYTTNNPFTYEVYAANEMTATELATSLNGVAAGTPIDYVAYDLQGRPMKDALGNPIVLPNLSGNQYHLNTTDETLYYRIDTTVTDPTNNVPAAVNGKYTGRYLNSTNGTAADNDDENNTYRKKAYDNYTYIQADAKPVYWQAVNVSAVPVTGNANKNSFSRHFILRVKWAPGSLDNTAKETDIVYITVKATS